jgi:hypothetical protein
LGDHLLLALAIASGAVAAIPVPADDQRIADELIAAAIECARRPDRPCSARIRTRTHENVARQIWLPVL